MPFSKGTSFSTQGPNPMSLMSSVVAGGFFTLVPPGKVGGRHQTTLLLQTLASRSSLDPFYYTNWSILLHPSLDEDSGLSWDSQKLSPSSSRPST